MSRLCACAVGLALLCALAIPGRAGDNLSLGDRTREYLTGLVRLDTSNPPGNETRVAQYLKQIADSYGISAQTLGANPSRLNFVARLRGNGRHRPLLLMAHSDVVPADKSQWTEGPFSGAVRDGYIYGRGALDTKSLLAAEMAVMVEIRRRNLKLDRDLILVSEADEEAGSAGIHWLMQHAWTKIDAEFALNEGGTVVETGDGTRLFEIQTAEKIPMRLRLIARGTAAHASLPRADNPVEALSEAIVRLSKADEPVHWNPTTRRYFRALAKIPEYAWLGPLVPRLNTPGMAQAASRQIRMRDADLDAMLHTTVSATMLRAGTKLNVIPNAAEAELDVRRMPSETREEVLARFRQIVNNPAIAIDLAPGPQMPAAGPSSASSPLYRAMERAVARLYPGDAVVTPYMSRGATDGSYLRARGMPVYGVPLFLREPGESRVHGNDERIATKSLENGVELLWQIVLETAGAN